MSRPDTILSRAVLSTAGMGVQGLARFLYTLAIGRLAGPEALGETTAVLSIAVYLSLAWPAGAGIAASRYLPVREDGAGALRVLKRSFWASTVVLAVMAIPLAFWVTGDVALAATCGILVFSYNAYVFTRGALMGEDRVPWSAIADTFSSLLSMTLLVLVLFGHLSWAVLLPLSVGYLAFAATSLPRTKAQVPTPDLRREVLSFTGHTTVGVLVTGGLLPATMIFVRAFDTPAQAGLFAAGLSLATPASLISQAVNQVLVPYFVRLRTDVAVLRRSHLRMFLMTSIPFAVMFGVLIALAPWLLTVLYGDRYEGGATPMQAILVIVFLLSATCAPSALLVADGRQRLYARIWTVAFIAGTLTMLVLAPIAHQWGAIIGFAVGAGGGSIAIIVAAFVARPVPITDEADVLGRVRRPARLD